MALLPTILVSTAGTIAVDGRATGLRIRVSLPNGENGRCNFKSASSAQRFLSTHATYNTSTPNATSFQPKPTARSALGDIHSYTGVTVSRWSDETAATSTPFILA
jgi:hypothetical protein